MRKIHFPIQSGIDKVREPMPELFSLKSKRAPRFLLIEDSDADAFLVERSLRKEWPDSEFERVETGRDFEKGVSVTEADLILCDFNLPAFDAWKSLRWAREQKPGVPFLILSGAIGEETAIELIKAGAADVILKSQLGRLPTAAKRAINERVMNSREREAKRLAEGAMRAREETLAVVSHDLRNPLSTVLLLSQIQMERLTSHPLAEQDRSSEILLAFSKIRRAAGFMRTLIEDLLLNEGYGKGELVISPSETEVASFARDLFEMFEPIARDRKIELLCETSLSRKTARIDPDRLFQAVANIVSNALKFTPRGGRVRIRVVSEPSKLLIEVMDSGPGISESMRGRIFEKYFQAEPADRRGVGLGLYIARTIIENHGGVLSLTESRGSELGGASFGIVIPLSDLNLERARNMVGSSDRPRVLFVDDDLDFRELVATELRGRGFAVIEHDSLESARSWIRDTPETPHVVMVDYSLPDGEGTCLAADFKKGEREGFSRIPIVLLSAEMNISRLACEAGISHYLVKPPNLPELVKKLNQLIQT